MRAIWAWAYLAYEGADHLLWLDAHGHNVNPFTNPDEAVLATWLDTAANAAGPLEAVGGAAARSLVAARLLSPQKAKLFKFVSELANKGTNKVALAHAVADVLRGNVTPEQALQTAVYTWMAFRHAPPRPAVETQRPRITPTTPPSGLPTARVVSSGGPIPIGSAPQATKNPTIGKLPLGGPVRSLRPAQPSSPGVGGYDPFVSGKAPANSNVSPDAVQPAIKMTADGSVPRDNRPTAMAGNKGDKPPEEPPTASPPSSKTTEATPPRPAGGDRKSGGSRVKSEVRVAYERLVAAQEALKAARQGGPVRSLSLRQNWARRKSNMTKLWCIKRWRSCQIHRISTGLRNWRNSEMRGSRLRTHTITPRRNSGQRQRAHCSARRRRRPMY
jgi:hypothetical protein